MGGGGDEKCTVGVGVARGTCSLRPGFDPRAVHRDVFIFLFIFLLKMII